MVVVDTGPLVAAAIRSDPEHDRCAGFFETTEETLVVPQLVLAEAGYLISKLVAPDAEARFVRELADSPFVFHPFDRDELRRAAELMETYVDLRLGIVDATVIASAEGLGVHTIATLDRRHFSVVRPTHVDAFELVP